MVIFYVNATSKALVFAKLPGASDFFLNIFPTIDMFSGAYDFKLFFFFFFWQCPWHANFQGQ